MEIQFQGHHTPMSPRLQRRAREGVTKLASRLGRPVEAVVRFEEDGPPHRHVGAQVDRLRRQRLARRVVRT